MDSYSKDRPVRGLFGESAPGVAHCAAESGDSLVPIVLPQKSRSQVDRAGAILSGPVTSSDEAFGEAYNVVADWRAAHAHPADRFRILLKTHACKVNPDAIVTQRLKRVRSIGMKLIREKSRLSQLQDIAGCRATVATISDVEAIVQRLRDSNTVHKLVGSSLYIDNPKDTGYRSTHLIWRFHSERYPPLHRMQCEMQIRTLAQNVWASSVELCGFFRNQDFKSGVGDKRWLRFFKLVSAVVAMAEGAAPIPGINPNWKEIQQEIADLEVALSVRNWLHGYTSTINLTQKKESGVSWYVIKLDTADKSTQWRAFTMEQLGEANDVYKSEETENKDNPTVQVVLVSANSLVEMKSAYASFFGNSIQFSLLISLIADHTTTLDEVEGFIGNLTGA